MAQLPTSASAGNGAFAVSLIGPLCRRLADLQAPVLAQQGTEPLHQMRVSMRRLRTCLIQFGPALDLPGAVSDRRLAKAVRRLGLARDLDVLRERLESVLLPQLPEPERRLLKPVLRQLRRERAHAHGQLESTLRSGSYLALLSQLQHWLRAPAFSPLGQQALRDWTTAWQVPLVAELFQHPGWFLTDPESDPPSLHDLRKQLKTARYGMENLAPVTGRRCAHWAGRFKGLQELLGELNDLQVLEQAIENQLPQRLGESLPQLEWLLLQSRRDCWSQWRLAAEQLQRPALRRDLWQALSRTSGFAGPPRQGTLRLRDWLTALRPSRRADLDPPLIRP